MGEKQSKEGHHHAVTRRGADVQPTSSAMIFSIADVERLPHQGWDRPGVAGELGLRADRQPRRRWDGQGKRPVLANENESSIRVDEARARSDRSCQTISPVRASMAVKKLGPKSPLEP